MGSISLLDCTLRDGGYVNDWRFGEAAIRGILRKIAQTGVEYCEVGFLKPAPCDRDRSMFPDTESLTRIIAPRSEKLTYAAMVDMSAPIPLEQVGERTPEGVDMLRVIFKKNRVNEGFEYCRRLREKGYLISANFVSTDAYTDEELRAELSRFATLDLTAVAIVDTFGLMKRNHFLHIVKVMDESLPERINLCYHSHNNLQQAFGNAEALVNLGLARGIILDACVFGMGRGAGNLNLELFAEFMNDNCGRHYQIQPMLEIMDEYLYEIYRYHFWGYSLPLYLSAVNGCHPNYAIYLEQKLSLTAKSFGELLKGMAPEDKAIFSKDKAEEYYRRYMENFVDDRADLARLSEDLSGKSVLVLAPGGSLKTHRFLVEEELGKPDTAAVSLNFWPEEFRPGYIFSSNMRRYGHIVKQPGVKSITTSNMKECTDADYVLNFSSYASAHDVIVDNSGLMLLRVLMAAGVRRVTIAGMDGYAVENRKNYYNEDLEYDFSRGAELRNRLISGELRVIGEHMDIRFLTPTQYQVG